MSSSVKARESIKRNSLFSLLKVFDLELKLLKSKTLPVVLNSKRTLALAMLKHVGQLHRMDIVNSVEGKISLCLPLLSIGILSDNLPFMITVDFMTLGTYLHIYIYIYIYILVGTFFPSIVQSARLLTVWKAFVKSIKSWYRWSRCLLHFPYTCLAENIMLFASLTDIKPLVILEWLQDRYSKASGSARPWKELYQMNPKEWFHGCSQKFFLFLCPCTNILKQHQSNHSIKEIHSSTLWWKWIQHP